MRLPARPAGRAGRSLRPEGNVFKQARRRAMRVTIVLCAILAAMAAQAVSQAAAAATQRSQPRSGPEGSQTAFGGVGVTAGGSGSGAWYVFAPIDPMPPSAPLVIIEHGYYEFSGYDQLWALARHPEP